MKILYAKFKMVSTFQEVNMRLSKLDELDALIAGVLFCDAMNAHECYYWAPPEEIPVHQNASDSVSVSFACILYQ